MSTSELPEPEQLCRHCRYPLDEWEKDRDVCESCYYGLGYGDGRPYPSTESKTER